MKKILLIVGICTIFACFVYADEYYPPAPAGMVNPTEEINSSFSQSKNTNWVIHRIKPTNNKKITTTKQKTTTETKDKQSFKDMFNSDKKLIEQINKENNTSGIPDEIEIIKPQKNTQNNEVKKEVSQQKTKTKQKQEVKETVHTTPPAEKVIKTEEKQEIKEEKKKLQDERERQQYRELQELTEQYQQAVALYNDNNLDASLEAFSMLPEDKRPPQAWLLMGNILMDKDKKDEAVFMYGRAILTDSTFYKAYYNLGNVYLADDKYNMAIEQYKTASKYCPNNPYVFYNLGCAYLKQGELKKAKNAFIRAVELNNTVADFHYNLAFVYKKLGKEKLAKTYLDNYNKLTGQVD